MIWKISFLLISMTIFSDNFAPNKIDEEPPRKRAKITNFAFNLFKFMQDVFGLNQTITFELPTKPRTTAFLSPKDTPEPTTTTSSTQTIPEETTSLKNFITKASSVSSVRQNATTQEIIDLLDQISSHKNSQAFSKVKIPMGLTSIRVTSDTDYFDYIFLLILSPKTKSRLNSQLNVAFILCQTLNMRSHLDILSQFFIIDMTGKRRRNFEQIFAQQSNAQACVFNALNDALLLINEENIESYIMRCCDTVEAISKLAGKLYDLTKSRDGESFIANHISSLNLNATNLLEATTDLIAICCYVEKTILSGNSTSWAEYFLSDTTTINVDKVLEDLDEIPAEAQKLINRLEQRTN